MKQNFYYLGTLTRPFGLKGDLCAFFDTDNPEKYQNMEAVFIEVDGDYIPYPIEHIQYRGGNQFIIKFADINAAEAQSLLSCELYLPMSELPKRTGKHFYFHEVIGFKVVDEEKGPIGTCRDFLEINNNPIMQVFKDQKEILIPVQAEFIQNVDRDNNTLYIHAPEGLIDLYLS